MDVIEILQLSVPAPSVRRSPRTSTPPATGCWSAGEHRDRRSNFGPMTPIRSSVPGPVCTDPAEITGPVGLVLLAIKATQNADGGSVAGPAV